MKNGHREVFVFRGIKWFLTQYRNSYDTAREARRIAQLYVEGLVDLRVENGADSNDADKLLRRLAASEVELLGFFVQRGPTAKTRGCNVAQAMYNRMAKSKGFAAHVHYAYAPKAARDLKLLDLRHTPGVRKAVFEVLDKVWHEHAAHRNGWQYMLKAYDPRTGKKDAVVKVDYRAYKNAESTMPRAGFDFVSWALLGYTKDVTWEEAAELDRKDPVRKDIFAGWASVGFEDARAICENRGLETDKKAKLVVDPKKGVTASADLLLPLWEEEEAFYFDPDFYLEPEKNPTSVLTNVLSTKAAVRQDLENAALLKRIATLDVTAYLDSGMVTEFTPPTTNQMHGRGGSRAFWASELGKSVRLAGSVVKRDAKPRWPHNAPSDRWLAERKAGRVINEEVEAERLARQALLDADEAEVREHAPCDVPETILDLLEEQNQEIEGKAPKGVIGALAAARLQAQRNTKRIAQHMSGLSALERAAAASV